MTRGRMSVIAFLGLLPPGSWKNRLLSLVAGYAISPSARVNPVLILNVDSFTVGAGATVGFGNVFRDVAAVVLARGSSVGQWNWLSGAPALNTAPRLFELKDEAAVTSRHYLDCTGGFTLGARSILGGVRTTVLTHQIDLEASRQRAAPVVIGTACFVSSNCKITAGAALPDRSVLGIGSVLISPMTTADSLYAGVPAARIRGVAGDYFHRIRGHVS
jgi:acetyltransferase-like isoleucine patch superfamily enzyme